MVLAYGRPRRKIEFSGIQNFFSKHAQLEFKLTYSGGVVCLRGAHEGASSGLGNLKTRTCGNAQLASDKLKYVGVALKGVLVRA